MLPSDHPWIDWISDPSADNDETLEPFLDEGFESEVYQDSEENDDED